MRFSPPARPPADWLAVPNCFYFFTKSSFHIRSPSSVNSANGSTGFDFLLMSLIFSPRPTDRRTSRYGGVRILLWKRGFCWNRRFLTTSNLETHADLHHLSQDHLGPQRDDWRLGKTVSYAVRRRLVQLIVYFDKLYKCSPSSTPRCSVAALKQRVQCPLRHSNMLLLSTCDMRMLRRAAKNCEAKNCLRATVDAVSIDAAQPKPVAQ